MKKLALLLPFIFLLTSCDNLVGNKLPTTVIKNWNQFHHRDVPTDTSTSTSLYVSMDNSNSETLKAIYELGGNTTCLLAAITLRTNSDTVQIDSLTVQVLTAFPFTFSQLFLVDSDRSTILAQSYNVQAATVMKGVGSVSNKSRTIYLKAVLNRIGKDEIGVIDASVKFQVGPVFAKRLNSAKSVKVVYENDTNLTLTKESKEVGVLAAKISSVDLTNSGSGFSISSSLSSGWNTAAIIKLTVDASNNSLLTGDEVKIILDKLRIDFNKNSGVNVDTVKIVRIDKVQDNTFLANYNGANKKIELDLKTLPSSFKEISPGGSAYFAVRVYVTLVDNVVGAHFIESDLNNLDGDSSIANFVWRDGSDAALSKSALRLSINKIEGEKITN